MADYREKIRRLGKDARARLARFLADSSEDFSKLTDSEIAACIELARIDALPPVLDGISAEERAEIERLCGRRIELIDAVLSAEKRAQEAARRVRARALEMVRDVGQQAARVLFGAILQIGISKIVGRGE